MIKNKLKILIFSLFPALMLFAQSKKIDKMTERIYTDLNGSAKVEWTIKPDSNAQDVYLLPFCFKNGNDFILNDSLKNKISIEEKNGLKYISISLLGFDKTKPIKIKFNVKEYFSFEKAEKKEFGNLSVKYKFTNTTEYLIKNFRSEIILPPGYVVTSIEESTPKQSSSKPEAPFEVVKVTGRHGIAIKAQLMKLGDNAAIQFKTKKEQKSYLFLTALLLLGGAYLFFFRDVLKEPGNGSENDKRV